MLNPLSSILGPCALLAVKYFEKKINKYLPQREVFGFCSKLHGVGELGEVLGGEEGGGRETVIKPEMIN